MMWLFWFVPLMISAYLVIGFMVALSVSGYMESRKRVLTNAQGGGIMMLWPLFVGKVLLKTGVILPRAMVRGVKAGAGLLSDI